MDDAHAANRDHWDALARVHGTGADDYYDLQALVDGRDSLTDVERAGLEASVGDVAGKDVLHVQCHLGLDAVSLARRGARVTAVDFAPVAVERARAIAAACGVEVEVVEADSTDLPASLHGRFDLAYATVGILGWIGDVDRWMASVGATLRPGGTLLLVDVHPLFSMVASTDPLVADFPYGYSGPQSFDEAGTYAGESLTVDATRTVEFPHSLGEVVTAAARSGLAVREVREHLDLGFDPRGRLLAHEADGRYRLRSGGLPVPVMYTLIATR